MQTLSYLRRYSRIPPTGWFGANENKRKQKELNENYQIQFFRRISELSYREYLKLTIVETKI